MNPRIAALLVLSASTAVASAQVRYEPVGWLNGGNLTSILALAPGRAVGVAYTSRSRPRAFSWTPAGGLAELPPLTPGGDSCALALSADGRVAVGWAAADGGVHHACVWVDASAPIDLGVLPGGSSSAARLVSGDGRVVYGVVADTSGPAVLFRWSSDSGMQNAGTPPVLLTAVLSDVSADGSTIAGYNNDARAGYVWSAARGLQTLATPQLTLNRARVDGWVAGYGWDSNNAFHAYIMAPGAGPSVVDLPGETSCSATDVEPGGAFAAACVDAFNAFGEARAYLRTPHGYSDLVPLVESAGYALGGWSLEGRVLTAGGGRWIAGLSRRAGAGSRGFVVFMPCAADLTGDGIIDGFDYAEYLADFESGAPAADFNGDGFLDFFDYTDFLAAFESGC